MNNQEPISEQKLKSLFTRFLKESHPRAFRVYQESYKENHPRRDFVQFFNGRKRYREPVFGMLGTHSIINSSFTWCVSEDKHNMPNGFWCGRDIKWNHFLHELSKTILSKESK